MAEMLGQLILHPLSSMRLVLRRIKEIPQKGLPRFSSRDEETFDSRYDVETSGMVRIVSTASPNAAHGNRYEACSEEIIRWSIEHCASPAASTVFIDIGCGKGKAMIIAAEYGFSRIIGIEYSESLAKAAIRNLETSRVESQVLIEDAVAYRFPPGQSLVFMYNPFDQHVFRQVLRHIPSSARIAYCGPGQVTLTDCGWTPVAKKGAAAIYVRGF
jgi:SAM-dependent methyltransferase